MDTKEPVIVPIKPKHFRGWRKIRCIAKLQFLYTLSSLWIIISTVLAYSSHSQIKASQKSIQMWGLDIKHASIEVIFTCIILMLLCILVEAILHVTTSVQVILTNWNFSLRRQFLITGGFSAAWRFAVCTALVVTIALSTVWLEGSHKATNALNAVFVFCLYRCSFFEMDCYTRELTEIRVESESGSYKLCKSKQNVEFTV